jgi:hypothetical protein
VKANHIPEYEVQMHRNGEGEEVVTFVHRSRLSVMHPRFEDRSPRRRQSRGIFSDALRFNALPGEETGD